VVLLLSTTSAVYAQAPVAAQATSGAVSAPEEYRIGPGDELSITFPNQSELNHDGIVGPDGRFPIPLLGNVLIAGETPSQTAAMITAQLQQQGIANNAVPNITFHKIGTSVYVGGQVHQPGVVQLASGMDALQAVIAAGGFTDEAKAGRIAVIRRSPDNKPAVTYVDLKAYTKGKDKASIALLSPRDVIFVPRKAISEVDLWIDQYINKTLPFNRGVDFNYGYYPVQNATPATAVTK